jgi:hypothetical protein
MQRNLSGVYIRYKNPETKKWENWCIEDIPEEERTKFLEDKEKEWCVGLINILSKTLNEIGNQLDIFKK